MPSSEALQHLVDVGRRDACTLGEEGAEVVAASDAALHHADVRGDAVGRPRGGAQWTRDGAIRERALEKAAVPGLRAAAVEAHGAQLGDQERSALDELLRSEWQAAAGREGRSSSTKPRGRHRCLGLGVRQTS
eukprot:scaffold109559_cov57-Phaeocystis_antarctica.AAC.1